MKRKNILWIIRIRIHPRPKGYRTRGTDRPTHSHRARIDEAGGTGRQGGQEAAPARHGGSDAPPFQPHGRGRSRLRHQHQDEPAVEVTGRPGRGCRGPRRRNHRRDRHRHAPHTYEEKLQEFDRAPNGIIGL